MLSPKFSDVEDPVDDEVIRVWAVSEEFKPKLHITFLALPKLWLTYPLNV